MQVCTLNFDQRQPNIFSRLTYKNDFIRNRLRKHPFKLHWDTQADISTVKTRFSIAIITAVIFRKTTTFERGKVIEKDVFSSCHERETKKNFPDSPWGIEPQTFGYRAQMLYHWAIETLVMDLTLHMTIFKLPIWMCHKQLTRQLRNL